MIGVGLFRVGPSFSMIIQRFVRWCETATSRQRAAGYVILAEAIVDGRVEPVSRREAHDALHLVLDDPSPKVRLAVAEAIGAHDSAPHSLIRAFLFDTDAIAVAVARSPVLRLDDLTDAVRAGRPAVQVAVAWRHAPERALSAVIATAGTGEACAALLDNPTARLDASILRRVAERFAAEPGIAARLAERAELPADVRQTLVLEAATRLQRSSLVANVLGPAQTARAVFDACERATARLGDALTPIEGMRFVEHLRVTGQLSPAFLVRSLCAGNIEVFAAALSLLSGMPEARVRAVVVDGREGAVSSLLGRCGLDRTVADLLQVAVRAWKDAVRGRIGGDADELSRLVVKRIAATLRANAADNKAAAALRLLDSLGRDLEEGNRHARLGALLAA